MGGVIGERVQQKRAFKDVKGEWEIEVRKMQQVNLSGVWGHSGRWVVGERFVKDSIQWNEH